MAKPKFFKKLGSKKQDGSSNNGIDKNYIDTHDLKSAPTDPESPASNYSGVDVEDQFSDISLSQQHTSNHYGAETGNLLDFDAPAATGEGPALHGESLLDNSNEDLLGFSSVDSSPAPAAPAAAHAQAPSRSSLTVDAPMDASLLIESGILWARATPNKIMMKDWQEMSWVQYGSTTLYLFRNRQDFMDWKHYSFHGGMATLEVRDRLVKKKVDFCAEMAKKNVQGYTLSQVNAKTYNQIGMVPL
jgi:hypothetical protein